MTAAGPCGELQSFSPVDPLEAVGPTTEKGTTPPTLGRPGRRSSVMQGDNPGQGYTLRYSTSPPPCLLPQGPWLPSLHPFPLFSDCFHLVTLIITRSSRQGLTEIDCPSQPTPWGPFYSTQTVAFPVSTYTHTFAAADVGLWLRLHVCLPTFHFYFQPSCFCTFRVVSSKHLCRRYSRLVIPSTPYHSTTLTHSLFYIFRIGFLFLSFTTSAVTDNTKQLVKDLRYR